VGLQRVLIEQFIASFDAPPEEIVLDFDATDVPVHGRQQGRFFHGYYDHHCFLPLYVFCGEQLLVAYLRPSKIDAAKQRWAILALLVRRLRQAWPSCCGPTAVFAGRGSWPGANLRATESVRQRRPLSDAKLPDAGKFNAAPSPVASATKELPMSAEILARAGGPRAPEAEDDADPFIGHCQVKRPWYALHVGGAAARVGELLC
jgi:hypothetical protein